MENLCSYAYSGISHDLLYNRQKLMTLHADAAKATHSHIYSQAYNSLSLSSSSFRLYFSASKIYIFCSVPRRAYVTQFTLNLPSIPLVTFSPSPLQLNNHSTLNITYPFRVCYYAKPLVIIINSLNIIWCVDTPSQRSSSGISPTWKSCIVFKSVLILFSEDTSDGDLKKNRIQRLVKMVMVTMVTLH